MTYASALKILQSRQECRMELGLSRVLKHLDRLGRPQNSWSAIHVAGTNGKGSVCAMLESGLRAAGHKTGLYTSPHLRSPLERIKVDGRPISKKNFASALSRCLAADPGKRLTYFELLTSAAFLHFRDRKVVVAVLETGLGGRLDATNVLTKPLACVITSIDYDHTAVLGTTLAAIAREKAGIIKRGVDVYSARLNPAATRVIKMRARRLRARLHMVSNSLKFRRVSWRSNQQVVADASGREYSLSLLGRRQRDNAQLVLKVLTGLNHGLQVDETARANGLASVRWPGRFQVLSKGDRTVILDGAHNPEAMRELMNSLRETPWALRSLRFIVGVLKDKDVAGLVKIVTRRKNDEFVAVRPESPRALSAEQLAEFIRREAPKSKVGAMRNVRTALESWQRDSSGPRTAVVCGSFYLVGQALEALQK